MAPITLQPNLVSSIMGLNNKITKNNTTHTITPQLLVTNKNNPVFGASTQVLSSTGQLFGSTTQLLGTNAQVFGTNAHVLGTNAQILGSSAQVLGTSAQVLSTNQILTSTASILGNTQHLISNGQLFTAAPMQAQIITSAQLQQLILQSQLQQHLLGNQQSNNVNQINLSSLPLTQILQPIQTVVSPNIQLGSNIPGVQLGTTLINSPQILKSVAPVLQPMQVPAYKPLVVVSLPNIVVATQQSTSTTNKLTAKLAKK
jgi:hypothetical protein